MKKNIGLSIFYSSFLITLICIFGYSMITGYEKESWNISEFLINYQGGFVRRGLPGEILWHVYNFSGISPYLFILLLCISAYFLLLFFFIRTFIKNGYPIFILPFVFFLGNPVINDFWVRKDVLITLFFIAIIYCSMKKSGWYLILVNLLFMTALLIHESIGFFCFPILLFILASRKTDLNQNGFNAVKAVLLSFLQLLPSAVTFLSVLYYKGSKTIADAIWKSWETVPFPIQAKDSGVPAAINMISKTLNEGLLLVRNSIIANFDGDLYAPLVWLIIIALIYHILTNTDKLNIRIFNYKPIRNFDKTKISGLLIVQLFGVLPLFILGVDYGRWIFLWVVSSFSVMILIPEEKLSFIIPRFISIISSKLSAFLDSFLGHSTGFMLLLCLIIGFPMFGWNLLLCVSTSSVMLTLNLLSHVIYSMMSVVF